MWGHAVSRFRRWRRQRRVGAPVLSHRCPAETHRMREPGGPLGRSCFIPSWTRKASPRMLSDLPAYKKAVWCHPRLPFPHSPFLSPSGGRNKEIKMGANEERPVVVLSLPCSLFSTPPPIRALLVSLCLLSHWPHRDWHRERWGWCQLQGYKQLSLDSFLLPPLYSFSQVRIIEFLI